MCIRDRQDCCPARAPSAQQAHCQRLEQEQRRSPQGQHRRLQERYTHTHKRRKDPPQHRRARREDLPEDAPEQEPCRPRKDRRHRLQTPPLRGRGGRPERSPAGHRGDCMGQRRQQPRREEAPRELPGCLP
eukprot:5212915-Alexandrium_andersonii.AAC.1